MERSESVNELSAALSKFQGEMNPVIFDSNNPYYKSKYASLSALVSHASPELAKVGLSVTQLLEDDGTVETILFHASGQWIESRLKLKPTKEDPQGVGSAITYARRYSYAAILGLVSDEDDDGNAASGLNNKGKADIEMPKPKATAPASAPETIAAPVAKEPPVAEPKPKEAGKSKLSADSVKKLNIAIKNIGIEAVESLLQPYSILSIDAIDSDETAMKIYDAAKLEYAKKAK